MFGPAIGIARTFARLRDLSEFSLPHLRFVPTGSSSAIPVRLFRMNECRYCRKMRDEWDCHGQECRTAIAKALRRQRLGLPMVPNLIRNEIPAGASTGEVITVLWRQRVRARRANEERRNRKSIDDFEGD